MNYWIAMQEAHTTSNMTRKAWGENDYLYEGSFLWDKPFYDDDGETLLYTLPTLFAGYIKKVDGIDEIYEPTEEDQNSDDWKYWD